MPIPTAEPPRKPAFLTAANLKSNFAWGDTLQKEKPDGIFRLYGMNPNGFRLDKKGGDIAEFFMIASSISADFVGVSEHNLDFQQFRVQHTAFQAVRHTVEHSKIVWSTTTTKFDNMYKPGGTMCGVIGNAVARVKEVGRDDLGRWSYIKLRGKEGRVINIITVYQVCKKPETAMNKGKCTAATQQRSLLIQRNKQDPSPIKHFRTDLNALLKTMTDKEEMIILLGDFNEVFGSDSNGISKLARVHKLVDIMHTNHQIPDPATYARGKDRLDYVLVSATIQNAVSACGYDPFNERFFCDHRGYFVDFDILSLFGNELQRLAALAFRDVRGKDSKCVTQYVEAKDAYLVTHKFYDRIEELNNLTEANDTLAESVDRDWLRASKTAGKRSRKVKKIWWSSTLAKAKEQTNLLRTLLSMLKQKRNYRPQIGRLRALHPTIPLPDTLKACSKALRAARQNEKSVIAASLKHREEEQLSHMEMSTLKGDKSKADILRNIRKAEELKHMFQKLRFIRGKNQKSGMATLEVPTIPGMDPKTCKDWTLVECPKEIMEYLLARNRKHFGQAKGTPFTLPPLAEKVDFQASTAACEMILNGDFSCEELEDLTQILLHHFSRRQELDNLPSKLTKAELLGALSVWNEGTSTSPSEMNLGHYHAMFRRHDYQANTEKAKAFEAKQEKLVQAQLALLNYALRFGHSFHRWKTIVNVMIQKDPGNSKIHRLRVIHIYEADYNLLLGVKWRQLLHQAEDKGLINKGCYGSRPGKEARTLVFMEMMQMEISRSSRKPFIKFDNDATSCFDRIVPGTAMLISRKYGLHRNVAAVCGKTLQEAHYKIKTMLGVSEEEYSHCKAHPIYGTGQGSRNSPTCWLLICSTLFDCFETQAYGASYESVDRDTTIRLFMAGFVDDNAGQINIFGSHEPPSPELLLDRMQHDAQLWADILWESGGDLELPKCSYHFVYWNFLASGKPFLRGGRVGPALKLLDGNGNSVTIESKSNYSSHKTLGCFIEPRGNLSGMKEHLRSKMTEFHRVLVSSALTRREAWTFYFAIYLPSTGYPLPLCHFKKSELDTLHRKVMSEMIARCGFCRKTKHEIIYGPADLAGACFRHPYAEQGTGQVLFFLKYWRSLGQAGALARIALSWTQYQVGTGKPILEDCTTPLPHMEACWLASLRLFLGEIGGEIRVDNSFLLAPQREYDPYIMDLVLQSEQFQPSEIEQINYCRLFLQSVTVSDISLADGIRLDPHMRIGKPNSTSSTTTLHRINQIRPDDKAWRLWQRANLLWADPHQRLHQQLGRWLYPPPQLRRNWQFYHDIPNDELLSTHPSGHYLIHSKQNFGYISQADGHTNGLPTSCRPASVIKTAMGWSISRTTPVVPQPLRYLPGTFEEFLDTLPTWESHLLQHTTLHQDLYTLHHSLQTGQACIGVSDGSVHGEKGAFGWCISHTNGNRLATGMGPAQGWKPSSYRAEGYGLLSILRFLVRLFEFCSSEPRCSKVYCDNLGLITKILSRQNCTTWYPNETITSEWDLIQNIVSSLQIFPTPPMIVHVKGHQDDHLPYDQLPLEAQLNVDADAAATEYQTLHGAHRPVVPPITGNGAHLLLLGKTVTHHYVREIRHAYAHPLLKAYIGIRNQWPPPLLSKIDWESLGAACNAHHEQRHFVVKLSHDLLPTRSRTTKYDASGPAACPFCLTGLEDRDHLLRCGHTTCAQWRSKLLPHIRKRGEPLHTDPVLLAILMQGLDAWLRHQPAPIPSDYPRAYRILVQEQALLGWRQLFNGRWSLQWSQLQDRYLARHFDPIPEPLNGRKWTTHMITVLWKETRSLWDIRNGRVHGSDSTTRAKMQKEKVHRELIALYNMRELTRHCDRDIFLDTALDHLETQPVWAIKNWLHIH